MTGGAGTRTPTGVNTDDLASTASQFRIRPQQAARPHDPTFHYTRDATALQASAPALALARATPLAGLDVGLRSSAGNRHAWQTREMRGISTPGACACASLVINGCYADRARRAARSEEHTSELQSREN